MPRAPVFAAQGPGIRNALRLRFDRVEPDQCSLRMVADGTTQVDLPLLEFWGFARRQRPQARFQSLLLGVDAAGAYYCFRPMPHRDSIFGPYRGVVFWYGERALR